MSEHSHLYALINSQGYRVPVPTVQCETIAIENMTSKTQSKTLPSAKVHSMKVIINTTDFQSTQLSNRLACENFISWISDSKATVVTDLRDTYKIQIDYTITSATKELIDEGVTTQTVEPKFVMVTTPISEDNELTYRKALRFDKIIKFNKAFPASYGALRSFNGSYYLKINCIKLLAISDMGLSDAKDQYIYPSILDNSGRMQLGITTAASEGVTILNTNTMGITFEPEQIPFKPRELGVDITILMNEFCEFASDTEVLTALAANDGGTTSGGTDDSGNELPCHPNIHPHKPGPGGCKDHWTPVCPSPEKPLKPKPDDGGSSSDDDLIWALQLVDATTPDGTTTYTVVSDDLDETVFDSTTMVKLADAQKYIPDVSLGATVFWGWVWNI